MCGWLKKSLTVSKYPPFQRITLNHRLRNPMKHKSKKSENLCWCGRQNMLRLYLKNLAVGIDFRPCSEGDILTRSPQSVHWTKHPKNSQSIIIRHKVAWKLFHFFRLRIFIPSYNCCYQLSTVALVGCFVWGRCTYMFSLQVRRKV